jgi:serine/threonine protein kinase
MLASSEFWPRDALPRGTALHSFTVEAILGRGGFGITYRVRDKIDQVFAVTECFPRQFAVRQGLEVLPTDRNDAAIFADCLDRFMREAKALTRLSQLGEAGDGVVKVMTFLEAYGTAYIVMEFLAGQSLEALIDANRSGLDSLRLGRMLDRLLQALGAEHDAGMLHRDIKPANIFVRDDGSPVLIDFGAARTVSGGTRNTAFTQIYSKSYAPIEQQLEGGKQGRFSDLHALGMTCYQAIGGTMIDAVTRERALQRGGADPLPPAGRIGAGRYPKPLLAAIDVVLAVAPEDRAQTVAEVLVLLGTDSDPTKLRHRAVPEVTAGFAPLESVRTTVPGKSSEAETTRLPVHTKPMSGFEDAMAIAAVILLLVAGLSVGTLLLAK